MPGAGTTASEQVLWSRLFGADARRDARSRALRMACSASSSRLSADKYVVSPVQRLQFVRRKSRAKTPPLAIAKPVTLPAESAMKRTTN